MFIVYAGIGACGIAIIVMAWIECRVLRKRLLSSLTREGIFS